MKFFAAVAAALVAVGSAQSCTDKAPTYLPFENPGAGKCMIKGKLYKPEGASQYYSLTFGSCGSKNATLFEYKGKGKELRTSDKWCLDTKSNSDKTDIELVLRKCPSKVESKHKGMTWTKMGKNQWQNGNKRCIEYNTKSKKFVQAKCAELKKDDKKSMQQWRLKEPAQITCATWGKKWICGSGWTLNTAKDLTCYGATDAKCANVCCKPKTTCSSAGFSKKCPAGTKFVNRECGNPGQPACSTKQGVCCDTEVIKCNQWNRCSAKNQLKPKAKDIWCTTGTPVNGQGYAPKCSDNICCDPKPAPITCNRFSCPSGYEHRSDAHRRQCFANKRRQAEDEYGVDAAHHQGGGSIGKCSTDFCCVKKATPPPQPPKPVKPITCAQWSGSCDNKAGFALDSNADKIYCHNTGVNYEGTLDYAPYCARDVCCVRDNCKTWLETKHEKITGDLDVVVAENIKGEAFCKDPKHGFLGAMDSENPKFEEPCFDADGKATVCTPAMCCAA